MLKYEEISETDSEDNKEEENFDDKGLGNNLRPKYKIAMKISDKSERFYPTGKRDSLYIVWDSDLPGRK